MVVVVGVLNPVLRGHVLGQGGGALVQPVRARGSHGGDLGLVVLGFRSQDPRRAGGDIVLLSGMELVEDDRTVELAELSWKTDKDDINRESVNMSESTSTILVWPGDLIEAFSELLVKMHRIVLGHRHLGDGEA